MGLVLLSGFAKWVHWVLFVAEPIVNCARVPLVFVHLVVVVGCGRRAVDFGMATCEVVACRHDSFSDGLVCFVSVLEGDVSVF